MNVRSYKILFLCQSMSGGGVERSILNLLKATLPLNKNIALGMWRHEGEFLSDAANYQIICNKASNAVNPEKAGLGVINSVIEYISSVYKVRQLVKDYQPDIVVTFTLRATIPMSFSHRFLKKRKTSWVISEGSNTAESVKLVTQNRLFVWIYRCLLGWVFNKASYIVPVSMGVGAQVAKDYRVPDAKIKPIYNPIDINAIQTEMSGNLEVPIIGKFILGVGRLVKVKGFDCLIRSFARLNNESGLKLLILGEGPERVNLEALIKELGIEERVLLLGFVFNPWAYMKQAEILVVSSYYEGFCNTIAEAMAVGVPVISTSCNYGPKEIIIDGKNGKLVPVGDEKVMCQEMKALLADSETRLSYVKEGKETVRSFAMEKIAQRYVELFDSIVK